MDYSYRKRRRSIVVTSTSPATTAQATVPPRAVVATLPRAPRRAPAPTILAGHTSFQHVPGVTPTKSVVAARPVPRRLAPAAFVAHAVPATPSVLPPPQKVFHRPKVVERPRRAPQPILVRTSLPVFPAPHSDATRPVVPKVVRRPPAIAPQSVVVSTHRGFANLANIKLAARVVPHFARPRGAPAILARSIRENRPLVLPCPDPLVVPRLAPRPGKPTILIHAAKPNFVVFDPIVVPRLAARTLPSQVRPGQVVRPARQPILTPSRAIVVPAPRRKVLVYPAIDPYDLKPAMPRAITPPMPSPLPIVAMPPLAARRGLAMPIVRRSSALWTGPALQVLPSFAVVQANSRVGRRAAPATIITSTHIPITMTPDPVGEGYYDIIAASIAWLRTNAAIVASFGDDHAGGTDKFTSDTEPRGIDPPYAVFHEPQEHTSFESRDPTGLRSAVVEGVYTVEVFATGKLAARKSTDLIGDWLSDAPLVFDEGLLLYIKAVDHQYPTLAVPGPGTNVVMYKRAIDFEYKFERYIGGQ